MVRSSRVDQPPVSGVPVAGATTFALVSTLYAPYPSTGQKGPPTRRIKSVNVEGQVHGILGTDTVQDFLDDAVGANLVDLASFNNFEPAVPVILIVARPTQGGADAGVDVGVVAQQAFLGSMVEVRPVVDASHLGWRAAKDFRSPRVKVAVKVDDGHGSVRSVDGPQQGKRYRVVTSECNDTGQGLAALGRPLLLGVRLRLAGENAVMALLDLVEGERIVVPNRASVERSRGMRDALSVRSHRNISTVQHRCPAVEGVRVQWHIIAATTNRLAIVILRS